MNINEDNAINLIRTKVRQSDPGAEVVIFGNCVRDNISIDSDWSVLVITQDENINWDIEMGFRELIYNVESEIGRPISAFVFSRKHWESKSLTLPSFQNVTMEGIVLN